MRILDFISEEEDGSDYMEIVEVPVKRTQVTRGSRKPEEYPENHVPVSESVLDLRESL